MKKKFRNIKMFNLYQGLRGFAPHNLIAVLYVQSLLGSYTLAMSVLSVVFISVSFAELPMGIVSDHIGRRKSMILGSFLQFVVMLLYTLPAFWRLEFAILLLMIGSVLQGLVLALFSGTDEAILYETSLELDMEKYYTKFFGAGRGINQLYASVSAVLGGIIAYYYSYAACYVFSTVISLFLFLSSFGWVEVNDENIRDGALDIKKHLVETFKMFRKSKKLRMLATASVISESASKTANTFEVAYFRMLVPEYLLGVPRTLRELFGAFGSIKAHRYIKKYCAINILIYSNFGMIFFRVVPLLMNNVLTPFIISMENLFFGAGETAESDLMQKEFSSKKRATMKSFISMLSALGTAVLAVVIGFVADISTVWHALLFFVLFKLLAVTIYMLIRKNESR